MTKDMRKAILRMAMCALLVCALPMALAAQDWQTSSMQGSGSAYSSQVTPVGATDVDQQATTTYGPARQISNRRNEIVTPGEHGQSDQSPIGDEWPLLFFAVAAAGIVALRKKVINSKI